MPTVPGRVAHVTTAHPTMDNRIFHKECIALAEAGLEIYLISATDNDRTIEGVQLKALPRHDSRLTRMLLGPWDAWRALREIQPSVVHVHDPELIPLAILWKFVYQRPAIFDAHEDLPKQIAGKPYLPKLLRPAVALTARVLEKAADWALDGIVAATPSIARNFNSKPVTLVQNFPWLRDFPQRVEPGESGRATICYVGGITRERGCIEMIEATLISKFRPELVLAGAATSDMEAEVVSHEHEGITYLGRLSPSHVPGIISSSRAGLAALHPLPNYLESQPTKLFEYMAAGRPFVASNFDYWVSLLSRFKCGIFIDPLDTNALSYAIDTIFSEPERAREMGESGRRAFEENFTFDREALRLVNLTMRLLDVQ
jgi:glycosyltransferase involved in cell wall biosynthesis